jgi:hypothetical protein
MPLLPSVFLRFLPLLPLYFLWVLGIVLALILFRKHPRVSMLAAAACVIMIANSMTSALVYTWLPGFLLQGQNYTQEQFSQAMAVVGVGFNLVSAVAWALILAAIFIDRHRPGRVTDLRGRRDAED